MIHEQPTREEGKVLGAPNFNRIIEKSCVKFGKYYHLKALSLWMLEIFKSGKLDLGLLKYRSLKSEN